ncbi:MAG: hypothetical protein ACPL3C_08550 [Pyrobaculum sp.]|uniref:hypothetical protein n=1 Tax=Pyrobaculum sp. TaxID=2004705 RepID=UPI003CC0551D
MKWVALTSISGSINAAGSNQPNMTKRRGGQKKKKFRKPADPTSASDAAERTCEEDSHKQRSLCTAAAPPGRSSPAAEGPVHEAAAVADGVWGRLL